MITVNHTPNMTGVLICGDREDLEQLYDALHQIVGGEGDSPDLKNARMRVLGLCYDLRHALMGHRNAGFKDHGLDHEQMKYLSLVGTKQNLYLSFEAFWPEMLYIMFVLNTFIEEYERREKVHKWDGNIAAVRLFQHQLLNLIEETVTPRQFATVRRYAESKSVFTYSFYRNTYTQYIDYLNMEWMELEPEERVKKLSVFAKRVSKVTTDYERFKAYVDEEANRHNVSPGELRYGDYDHIIW